MHYSSCENAGILYIPVKICIYENYSIEAFSTKTQSLHNVTPRKFIPLSTFIVWNLFPDPTPAVNFTAVQSFRNIVMSWTGSPDEPYPITKYTITINGSSVSVPGNDNQYTRPITDECGSTLEISAFATSAVGRGEITATNLTIVAARECCSMKCFIRKY